MKATLLVVGLLAGLTSAQTEEKKNPDKQACMYCKRADTNAGYMNSFSFCPDEDNEKCFRNFWLYINGGQKCKKSVKDGWTLDVDEDCISAESTTACSSLSFVSDEEKVGDTIPRRSVALGENTKCTFEIDATDAVARITFSGNNLGVLMPGYV